MQVNYDSLKPVDIIYPFAYFGVSLLWMWYFHRLAKYKASGIISGIFLGGLLVGPVAGAVCHSLINIFIPASDSGEIKDFFVQFFIVGPIEEISKFMIVFLIAFRRSELKTYRDGMIMALTAALGFAAGENVLYLLAFGVHNTLPRLILGNIGHAAYSLFWGYAFGSVLAEFAPIRLIAIGLFIASFAHGLYNYMLNFGLAGFILSIILSSGLFLLLIFVLKHDTGKT